MLKYPHDDQTGFAEAVRTSARDTQFSEALIEKDYFCSLILRELFASDSHGLIFKGGTLLNKSHAGFYRLSEDLDFSLSASPDLSRKKRSELAKPFKDCLLKVVKTLSFQFGKEMHGSNENSHYSAEIEYQSSILSSSGAIKIEIGLREPVLRKTRLKAKTLVRNLFKNESLIPDFEIDGLDLHEAYAEKIRAALTRRAPAIRDIFDLDFAMKKNLLNFDEISTLVKQKISVQNLKPDLNERRKMEFADQLQTNLRPVLREKDYREFHFESAWANLVSLHDRIFGRS